MTYASGDRAVQDELDTLRRTRQARVDRMLHDEMVKLAPGNAVYWIAVVAGSFLVNILVLLLITR
jgi:hypothetical protein